MLGSLFQMWPALKAHANMLDLYSFNFLVDAEFVELVTVVHANSGTIWYVLVKQPHSTLKPVLKKFKSKMLLQHMITKRY